MCTLNPALRIIAASTKSWLMRNPPSGGLPGSGSVLAKSKAPVSEGVNA